MSLRRLPLCRFQCLSSCLPRALVCLVALLSCSQVARAAQAEAATARRVILTDGVRLILKPESSTDIVAITIFVRMDPDATPAEAAVGDMVSHALFFGSLNRSSDSVAASIAQVGGSLETRRTPDYVAITCVTVSPEAREAIYMLCEALKNADFSPASLERARQNLLRERRKLAAAPFETAYNTLCRTLQGQPQPDDSLLGKVTQEQATAYFRSRYVPERTVIAVAGEFNPALVQKYFDNDLFDYDRQRPRLPAPPARRPVAADQALNFSSSGAAAYALVGASTPVVASPDYPAFTVLQALLGGGHAARLFRRLRDEQGLGYTVGANYAVDQGGPLIAYLQWDTRRVRTAAASSTALTAEKALKLLQAQLDGLASDPPTDAEIARARNVAIGRDALRHERTRERAFFLGWYEVMGPGYAYDADFPRRLAAVSRADLLHVIQTYLSPRATALVLPSAPQ